MKSERRHELKSNDFAEMLENLPEWLQTNKFEVIIGVIAVILVLVSAYFYWFKPKAQITREQIQMTQLAEQVEMGKLQIVASRQQGKTAAVSPEVLRQAADQLETISSSLPDNTNEAFALIKRGEALRAQLHYSIADLSKDQRDFQMNKAVNAYQEAIDKSGDDHQILAQAKFGMGLTYEELGSWDKAKALYTELATDAKYNGTVIKTLASRRESAMKDYQGTFVFIDVPVAEPNKPAVSASAPAAPAKTADANKPAAK